MKRDDNQGCNGYNVNFNSSGQPIAGAGNILWSEVYLSKWSASIGYCPPDGEPKHVAIAAHELGHSIGLDHSANSSSLMKTGTALTAPNVSLDIAQDQACVGEKGVSCIYATN